MMPKQTHEPMAAHSNAYSTGDRARGICSALALMGSLLFLAGMTTGVESSEHETGSEQASPPFNANRDMVYLPEAKERLFDKLDANDDAAINMEEAQAHPPLAKQFDRIDSYDNDRITRSEFALFEVEDSGSK